MTRNKSKPLTALLVGLVWGSVAQAQYAANASGGDATGTGGSVAYSIGQVAYTTNNTGSGTVAQGVQHAYEIFTLSVVKEEAVTLTVFPNPTTENLTIETSDFNDQKLSYRLFDLQGRLVKSASLTALQTHLDTALLPSATYLLSVVDDRNRVVRTFKIIKN